MRETTQLAIGGEVKLAGHISLSVDKLGGSGPFAAVTTLEGDGLDLACARNIRWFWLHLRRAR